MEKNCEICIMENLNKSGIIVSLQIRPFETLKIWLIYMFEQIYYCKYHLKF